MIRLVGLAAIIVVAGCGKRNPGNSGRPDAAVAAAFSPSVESLWDPGSGRGEVRGRIGPGEWLRTCLHCGYPGYTGGLVIGNQDGPGMGYYPAAPIRGFRAINVFCAQDESIWDRDERAEYSYGWSENFGPGEDPKGTRRRLDYRRGRVIEAGPERVILQSENAGGCYRVTKVLTARAGARFLILATRITNACARPVRFDLWTGDDPWVGMYRSAEGDVGWTPDGIREREGALDPFLSGGLYDLGSRALGRSPAAFSNQADFLALDPATPVPDEALLANRFAHSRGEIEPARPLDDHSMIALNLGWTDRRLAPGDGFTFAMALGLAETGAPGEVPRVPAITDADWSAWRTHLKEGVNPADGDSLEMAAEEVRIRLDPAAIHVTGTYWIRNRGAGAVSAGIEYPILTAEDAPAPATALVDGRVVPLRPAAGAVAARFPFSVPGRSIARFVVQYSQPHTGRRAAYLVTSARRWPAPIARALFEVRHPRSMGPVRLSFPVRTEREVDGEVVQTIVLHDFSPERELELRW